VHRDAARPATGAYIEDDLPGGREVGGELHVQPSAAHSPRHLGGEREAGKYSKDRPLSRFTAMLVTFCCETLMMMTGDIRVSVCSVLSIVPRSRLGQVIKVQITAVSLTISPVRIGQL
jgi:hypothetical protein